MSAPSEAAKRYIAALVEERLPTPQETRALLNDFARVTEAQFGAILAGIGTLMSKNQPRRRKGWGE